MKIIKMILALVMAFSLLTPLQLPVEAAGTNMSNATKINLNQTVYGTINETNEVDYYKVYMSNSGTTVFEFESEANDFYFKLYDYDGNRLYYLNSDYDNVKGTNEGSIKLRLSAGTYYVAIGNEYYSTKGDYWFSSYFVNANETTTEYYDSNNNTINDANKIEVNKTYKGHIGLGDEKDFYKFYLKDSGKIFLSVDMSYNYSGIYLYDEDGNRIWYDSSNKWNDVTKKYKKDYNLYLNAGTYYLAITKYNYSENSEYLGAYSFKLNYKNTNEKVKEYCGGNNNSYNTASKITVKPEYTTFNGQIAIEDHSDFYKFYVSKDSYFDMVVTTTFDNSSLYIYDQNGNELSRETYVDVDEQSNVATIYYDNFLEKGTYYFCIMGEYSDNIGGYTVKTSLASPFYDILDSRYDWYFNTVNEAYYKDLVSGVSEGYFKPNATMTRGMVANVLYRMAGSPNVTYKKKFSDVRSGLWYSNAITWCSNKGVVSGYSNGKFGPDDYITREQMAAMCYNYAKYRVGRKPSATTSITKFKDDHKVTSYMKEAMKWAVASGIISGTKDGYLKPTAKASRAECTKMLLQLSKIVK